MHLPLRMLTRALLFLRFLRLLLWLLLLLLLLLLLPPEAHLPLNVTAATRRLSVASSGPHGGDGSCSPRAVGHLS